MKSKNGDYHVLRDAEWLKYLVLTEEQNINLERISSLENMPQNPVFLYVEQTLSILEKADIPELEKEIIEEVLIWSEAAKCGQPHKRKEWREKVFSLRSIISGRRRFMLIEDRRTCRNGRILKNSSIF